MRLLSPEVTSAFLTALSIGAAWFASWLARRGKKEDTRISERGQAFDELLQLADRRLVEITRLTTERDAAVIERERIRTAWEDKFDRQTSRCRVITEPLVTALKHLQEQAPGARAEASDALRSLAEHDERDHTVGD